MAARLHGSRRSEKDYCTASRSEERMKRKRLAAASKLQDGYPVVMQGAPVPQVAQPSITNPTYPAPAYGQNQGSKSFERVCEISSSAIPDDSNINAGDMKKKRKPESDPVDTQANPLKAPFQHGSEKQKPFKPSDEGNAGSLPTTATTATVLDLPTVLGQNQQPS